MVDTVKINCLQCDTLFIPKRKTAKYCSDACKRDFNRDKERLSAELDVDVVEVDVCPSPFAIDIAYWNDRARKGLPTTIIDFPLDKVCVNKNCNKKFETRLKLMRFCSVECYPFL